MSDKETAPAPEESAPKVPEDPETEVPFGYDHGGVPLWLTLIYVAFLTFLLVYVLDHLIPSWDSLTWHLDP